MARAQTFIFSMLLLLMFAVPNSVLASDNFVNPYEQAQQSATQQASTTVSGVTSSVNNTVGTVTSSVSNTVGTVTNSINSNVVQPVTGAVNNVVGGITSGINSALGGLGVTTPNAQVTATGKTFAKVKSLDKVCKFQTDTNEGLNIISKSVECFENMFMGIVTQNLAGMTDFMREAVFACMVLYVIFYGIKTSTGMITEQRARGEFFIHAIKIAFVSWMVMNYGILELWYLTIDFYNGMLDLVLVPPTMDSCPITSKEVAALWTSMDCILTDFIGWNVDNGYGKQWKAPLLFGMFTGALSSGAGGTLIALLVFMSVLTLVMSLMRVAFVYILSMMGLILAFMISPIMIPFMLFPQTKQMFDGWWKLIVSMVMQPVIIFAYLSFMLSMYMEIIDGEGGLKEIYTGVKPQEGIVGVSNRGTATGITSAFTMFDANKTLEMEPKLVFNLLSIFIISYLLSSFTTFVGSMAKELSGNALSPGLSDGVPKFLGGGG